MAIILAGLSKGSKYFPIDEETLSRMKEKYSPKDILDFTDPSCIVRSGMLRSVDDFDTLNKLAENISIMSDEESVVFRAAMQSEDPSTIEAMLDISEHTEEYELDRDAVYYDDFGREYIEAFLPEDFDTEVLDALGTYNFGKMVAEKIGACVTDYGVISERGRQLSEMVYKEDKLPVIIDDGEESETLDQTEQDADEDENIDEQSPDEEQADDPEQTLTDEHYQVVEIFGQEALFTEARIHDSEIPEGMYRYDFRGGDDIDFAALEREVSVDRTGSILTREPIDFGDKEYIELDENNSPNFTGEEMTIAEFAAMAVAASQVTRESDVNTNDPAPDLNDSAEDFSEPEYIPDDDQAEMYIDAADGADFVPFPDDYPDAYFSPDESDGGDYLFDAPSNDYEDFDPSLIDCDEDEGMAFNMT